MAQHDYDIADQPGVSFLSDLNAALAAIVSQNSGPTEPSLAYAYQWWADTTSGKLKMRNGANTDWVEVGALGSVNLGLLAKSGDTMAGPLTLSGDPTAPLHAATKQYVDAKPVGGPGASSYELRNIARITTPGSGTYTTPAWARALLIRAVGGGGGGGGGYVTNGAYASGAGGGAGGYAELFITAPASSYPYTVGAGGGAGAGGSGVDGGNGGNTTIAGMTASGGGGGGAAGVSPNNRKGGAGGSAIGGQVNIPGGGGGGGTASPYGSGGGAGGSTVFGGGGFGGSHVLNNNGGNGVCGGGGGGAGADNTNSGGAGGAGYIEIWEFA